MRKHMVFLSLLWLVGLMLTSCEAGVTLPSSSTCQCASLPDLVPLQAAVGTAISPDELVDKMSEAYQIPSAEISTAVESEASASFVWEKDGVRYRAGTEQGMLIAGWATDERLFLPSAQCVVTCWGTPDTYRGFFTLGVPGRALSFEMLFAQKGTLAEGVKYYGIDQESPPPISGRFPIRSYNVRAGGTPTDVLRSVYYSGLDQELLEQYKPWPGDWDHIAIDIDAATLTK